MLSNKLWGCHSQDQENVFGEERNFVFGDACNTLLVLSKWNFYFYTPHIKSQLTLKQCIHLTVQKVNPLNHTMDRKQRMLSNSWVKANFPCGSIGSGWTLEGEEARVCQRELESLVGPVKLFNRSQYFFLFYVFTSRCQWKKHRYNSCVLEFWKSLV